MVCYCYYFHCTHKILINQLKTHVRMIVHLNKKCINSLINTDNGNQTKHSSKLLKEIINNEND